MDIRGKWNLIDNYLQGETRIEKSFSLALSLAKMLRLTLGKYLLN